MSLQNRKRLFLLYFAVFAAFSLVESVLVESFLWAGFHGFGCIAMEYTKQGKQAAGILLLSPCLICFTIIIFFITAFHKQEQSVKVYFKVHKPIQGKLCIWLTAALCGICTGVIIFLLDSYTLRILWNLIYKLIYLIEHSAWMKYPAP